MEFNGTFLASIISFVVFVFLMNKILYVPMRNIVNERNQFIAQNYGAAEENDKKTISLENEREQKLTEAKENARNVYNDKVGEFKEKKNEIIRNAQSESQEELQREFETLDNISNESKQVLKTQITSLATDISEKILGYRSEIQSFNDEAVDKILYQ